MDELARAEVPVEALIAHDAALRVAVLGCQELLTLSLRFIPMNEIELIRRIHAALSIRPNG